MGPEIFPQAIASCCHLRPGGQLAVDSARTGALELSGFRSKKFTAGDVSSSPPRHQAPVCNTQKKTYCTNFTHFTYVPQPGVGWGGGVGWGAMTCTVMHTIALAHMLDATQLHLRTCWMLRNCTCAHVRCYAIALAHMLDATQLHLRTCWMLRNCTCAHVGCYAIALAHMLDATQLHLRTCSMLRNCTCAHVGCYAIALAHMLDATQLHLRTCWMLRNCTCAHVGCYAIALAHMFDATQLHLRTCWMLRNCTCAHVGCYAIALAHIYMIYFTCALYFYLYMSLSWHPDWEIHIWFVAWTKKVDVRPPHSPKHLAYSF